MHIFKFGELLKIIELCLVISSPGSTITFVMKKDNVKILPDISFLCFLNKYKSYRFGSTWEWVNYDIFHDEYHFTAMGKMTESLVNG